MAKPLSHTANTKQIHAKSNRTVPHPVLCDLVLAVATCKHLGAVRMDMRCYELCIWVATTSLGTI